MDSELERLIPHRPPMVFIDRLVGCDGQSAVACHVFRPGDYGTSVGRVLEVSLIESMAQTAAAMRGRLSLAAGEPVGQALLVGLEDIRFPLPALCGQELEIAIRLTRQIGPFVWVAGRVSCGGQTVMEGELKFFTALPQPSTGEP